jgi:hypothetical protein
MLVYLCLTAEGATRYVNVSSLTPSAPYTNWASAATAIQDAINAAAIGDVIVVTNGLYRTGGQIVSGSMSNRVAVTKSVTVTSVNGPAVTLIQGYQVPGTTNGNGALRCAYLANGATLIGFTLTNGATRTSGNSTQEQSGGGVLCSSTSASLSNCVVVGNAAYSYGGGIYSGSIKNCVLTRNAAAYGGGAAYGSLYNCAVAGNSVSNNGGGAYYGTLQNCTLSGNRSFAEGGGSYQSTLYNCVAYYNLSARGADPNYSAGSLNYCCTTPLPSSGTGNLDAEPQLASDFHLSSSSPCLGAGRAVSGSGVDIDGEPWAAPPSIGCDELYSASATGTVAVVLQANYTTVAVGFSVDLAADIAGRVSASQWNLGDGTIVSNRPCLSHAWTAVGNYPVILTTYNTGSSAGMSATVTVHVVSQPVHYVAQNSTAPLAPYTSWANAATRIQDAVDASSVPGAMVLVTNGVYGAGGRVVYGSLSNRVAVTKPLVVKSVNGPGATLIQGNQVPGATNGDGAIRCVYLADGALLVGFTLTNGATRAAGDLAREQSGGGAWCSGPSAVLSNCVIRGNSAYYGGGCYYGTLNGCTLIGNSASTSGGGVCFGALSCCILTNNSALVGGAAYYGTASNCTFVGNTATYQSVGGGGIYYGAAVSCIFSANRAGNGGAGYYSSLNGCAITGNSASQFGGGIYCGTLRNCTLTGNRATAEGGGGYGGSLQNCIVCYNTSATGTGPNYSSASLDYSCTTPLPSHGAGNFDSEPQLASSFRLSSTSPCLGAGSVLCATGADIDGEPWSNPPSVGCDEFYQSSLTGALDVAIQVPYTNVAAGFALELVANVTGRVGATRWEFGDGTIISNRAHASHAWSAGGDYTITLRAYNGSNPGGVSATTTLHVVAQSVHYVGQTSLAPQAPFTSWATAATNIQDAVDAATEAGGLILVSNGVYATGGRVVYGALTNRVAVTLPLTLQSLNGPGVTAILGCQPPGATNGDSATRCVFLAEGAKIIGFTLTNGATRTAGDAGQEQSGGALWCASPAAVATNCVLIRSLASADGGGSYGGTLANCSLLSNSASDSGGGAYNSWLKNCVVTTNRAFAGGGAYFGNLAECTVLGNTGYWGGGADYSTLNACTVASNLATGGLGGGAADCVLTNCTINDNSASPYGNGGGGTYRSTLSSCLLAANSAVGPGGGACLGTLYGCTLIGNKTLQDEGGGAENATLYNCVLITNASISSGGGGASSGTLVNCTLVGNSATYGGGAWYSKLTNCIVYYNTSPNGSNHYSNSMSYCCTFPMTNGVGNYTNEPLFANLVAGDLRLLSNSPCVNAGNNQYAVGLVDLDGNPRISGGTVDVGAYEFQFLDAFHAWLQRYGLPVDSSADSADSDGDGLNNWQEWLAGTNPTNAASSLRLLQPELTPASVLLRWNCSSNGVYAIQRSDRLNPSLFLTIGSNLTQLSGIALYTDTNAARRSAAFYRLSANLSGSSGAPSLLPPLFVPPSVTVRWTSVSNRTYLIERSTNLGRAPIFWLLTSNVPGLSGTNSFTDTNPPTVGPVLYRVGIAP